MSSTDDRFHAAVNKILCAYKTEIERKHAAEIEQLKEQINQLTEEREMLEMQKEALSKDLDPNTLVGYFCA
jgi:regulator of replication initiation timing